jgi:hypothetical protein
MKQFLIYTFKFGVVLIMVCVISGLIISLVKNDIAYADYAFRNTKSGLLLYAVDCMLTAIILSLIDK